MKYTVLDYFEETVELYPDKNAFCDVTDSISFSDLKQKSRLFASYIIKNHLDAKVVAFYMDKSVDTIIGFLGSVYAGNAYTQINTRFPISRIEDILQTITPCVIISDQNNIETIREAFGHQYDVILFDEIADTAIDEDALDQRRQLMVDMQPLYINFTSGSTGVPKGVVVGHRSVIDFITCFTEIFNITSDDSILNQAPFDFDVSVKDIYSGLFTGATVHIIPTEYFLQPTKLIDYICDRQATVLIWAVSALCFITSMNCLSYRIPEHLRTIMFSGEVMPIKHLNKLKKYLPDVQYVNLYGPTEITCNCTYYIVDREYSIGEKLPIGVPFPNERIYILDEDNSLVTTPGKKGELCVSGSALALGYYRNTDKTKDVFIQNPNNEDYSELIYKTGDIVEIGEDQNVYYCSRKDSQVKHAGHRIELSEIELAIEAVEDINRACCYFDDERDRIIAIFIGNTEKEDIIDKIKIKLPYYMIPSIFYRYKSDVVPITKNGKIDRKLLYQEYVDNKDE